MKYLIFDTETTGLPLRQIDYDTLRDSTGAVPMQYNPNGSPRLAQISWQISDGSGAVFSEGDCYVRPDGWVMPAETTRFSGISQQLLEEKGKPLATVLDAFYTALGESDFLVGHNLAYDLDVLEGELLRRRDTHRIDILRTMPVLDTMKSSVRYCAIPFPEGQPRKYDTGCDYKYPKLSELYRKLFGEDFSGAHNSMNDVAATRRCLEALIIRQVIKI